MLTASESTGDHSGGLNRAQVGSELGSSMIRAANVLLPCGLMWLSRMVSRPITRIESMPALKIMRGAVLKLSM